VLYEAFIESLYERRTPEAAAQAKKLESALGLRKRARVVPITTDTQIEEETTEEDAG
jgi:hypothetical protein